MTSLERLTAKEASEELSKINGRGKWKRLLLTDGTPVCVDESDFEFLSQWKWRPLKSGKKLYAARWVYRGAGTKRYDAILMHRVLLSVPAGKFIDHINGDSLDNRRENLRVCDKSQNHANRPAFKNNKSGYKGVHAAKKRFAAEISVRGTKKFLGTFETPEAAARAYDAAAIELHGDFARLNFPVAR